MNGAVNRSIQIKALTSNKKVVIGVNCSNGDHYYSYSDTQIIYRNGQVNTGYFWFEEEVFKTLVSDYLSE